MAPHVANPFRMKSVSAPTQEATDFNRRGVPVVNEHEQAGRMRFPGNWLWAAKRKRIIACWFAKHCTTNPDFQAPSTTILFARV
jgi:hypothetical protein